MFYSFAKVVMTVYLSIAFGFRVKAVENVPNEGSVIVVANHASTLDPVALGCACPRRINFMAKSELFENTISAAVMRGLHAFPVKRGRVDREAYRRSMDILKSGGVLGMFPEGTRSATGELQNAQPGAARFALQTGTPILPAAVVGTFAGHRKGLSRFREPMVRVVFGEPIWPKTPASGRITREDVDALAEEIMRRISELICIA